MTRQQLLISLSLTMAPADYSALTVAVVTYEMDSTVTDLKDKLTPVFHVFRLMIDEERREREELSRKRSEAGLKGLSRRWGKDYSTDSKDSKDSKCNVCYNVTENAPANGDESNGYSKDSKCNFAMEGIAKEETAPNPLSPQTPLTPITPKEEINNNAHTRKGISLSLEERKMAFGLSLQPYTGQSPGQYPREMVSRFYHHWAESNPGGKKMRWEMEKTFDIAGRLRRWAENDKNWNKSANQNGTSRKHSSDNFASKEELAGRHYDSSFSIDDDGDGGGGDPR